MVRVVTKSGSQYTREGKKSGTPAVLLIDLSAKVIPHLHTFPSEAMEATKPMAATASAIVPDAGGGDNNR